MILGIDVSSHQVPTLIDWELLSRTHRFVICRATYGSRVDARCAEHVAYAREAGLIVGLYHFYRPGEEAGNQLAAFGYVAEKLGMGAGWLVPAVDVERNEKYDGQFTPERYAAAELIAAAFQRLYGRCLVYLNPDAWDALEPTWAAQHELWLAHHGVQNPETPPGMQWRIWQHLVAPKPPIYAHKIDQNVARIPLPLIAEPKREAETEPAPPDPELIPLELDTDELRADRDRTIREDPDDE